MGCLTVLLSILGAFSDGNRPTDAEPLAKWSVSADICRSGSYMSVPRGKLQISTQSINAFGGGPIDEQLAWSHAQIFGRSFVSTLFSVPASCSNVAPFFNGGTL